MTISLENRPYFSKEQILKRFEEDKYSSNASEAVTVKWVFLFSFVYRADNSGQNVGWNVCTRRMKALKICFNHRVRRAPPYLRCSGWRPSNPPAFLVFSFFKASSTSSTVKSSSTISSLLSLDREVRLVIFLHTSTTAELEWDWEVPWQ